VGTRAQRALGALVISIAAFAAIGSAPAVAAENNCPRAVPTGWPSDEKLEASYSISGETATYMFGSEDESPSGGVPGLIAYCVYPGSAPDSVEVAPGLTGANGEEWVDPPGFDNFSFKRPDGNPSNIPFDGTKGITMGSAAWSAGPPEDQTIVLHINDESECSVIYGGNRETCFVQPSSGQQHGHLAEDLKAEKTATPSFERKLKWNIEKSVDKTRVEQIGGTATFNYTVTVTHTSSDGGWKVEGLIKVSNPNSADVEGVTVTDAINDSHASCVVTDGNDATIPAESTVEFGYTCSYTLAPEKSSETNTANVSWEAQTLSNGDTLEGNTLEPTAKVEWGTTTPALVDNCVNVQDTLFGGKLATLCVNASGEQSHENVASGVTVTGTNEFILKYSKTVNVPRYNCETYNNEAEFKTNTTATTGSAKQSVEVCGPARTGALTMGFWQNKNGQAIITGGASTSGVCNSGKWLRQFNPFKDLASGASCKLVAEYVTKVIKAATCSGPSSAPCNTMLKAQDLATSLDVYFSDASLGGNKIGAPAAIGGVKVDLTRICRMIDSAEAGQCSGEYENVQSEFVTGTLQAEPAVPAACNTPAPGAGSMSVVCMLWNAASHAAAGGTPWYGTSKAQQVAAKDAFDAINNQVVFAV
jgi:hypothetical protein